MSVELKPCPFDGGEAWIIEDRGDRGSLPLLYRPQCKKCGADRGGYRTKAEAVEGWNRRAPAPEAVAWRMMMPQGVTLRVQTEPFPAEFVRMMATDCGCWVEPLYARPLASAAGCDALLAAAKDFLKNLWKCDATVGMGREIDALKAAVEQAETRPR